MNEKEIAEILSQTREIGTWASIEAIERKQAHAIAEKLREVDEEASTKSLRRLESLLKEAEKEVVYEMTAITTHTSPSGCKMLDELETGAKLWVPGKALDDVPWGQRVTVTVTKEE